MFIPRINPLFIVVNIRGRGAGVVDFKPNCTGGVGEKNQHYRLSLSPIITNDFE